MEASLIENIARAPMDELEEFEAFARLIKQGRKVDEISRTFGVTELYVRQRLALANLHPKIKEAYRSGHIEAEDLQLLTAAGKRLQKEWVEAFAAESAPDNEEADDAPRGRWLKQWLFGGDQIATGTALFPLESYTGGLITDLFGDVSCFADHDSFWALQNEAIARLRDDLRAKGWKDVTILEKGDRFQEWQHVEVAMETGGNVYIEVRETGEVEVHEGYRERDAEPRRKRSSSEGEGDTRDSSTARPELTKAAENYLALHRHAIVRAELLARPGVALRLAVAHMVAGSPLWSVKPEPQRADKETIAASLTASRAQTVFETERQAILQLLDLEPSYLGTVTWSSGDSFRAASVFARLLELPDETVLRVLTLLMAETLSAGSALVEAVGLLVRPDVTKWWELDETLLDLIRDRGAVQAMLSEIAGQAIADANVSETAKVQKKIILDCLKGEGRDKSKALCRVTWPFQSRVTTWPRPRKSAPTGRSLRLCLPANNERDSGAEGSSAPVFVLRRVAKESMWPGEI
jgi:ParB family transcriptional regulator, chromosome partitioning protein